MGTRSAWRRGFAGLLQLVGIWAGVASLAVGAIIGSAIGSGFLAVWLFPSKDEGPTAATLHDGVVFVIGALIGGGAALGLLIVAIAIIWEGVFSSTDDPMMSAARHGGR